MSFDLVIKHADVVTASDRFTADIGVRDGRITDLATEIPADAGDRVIDATGKLTIPGGIDPHVHLELPFCGTVSADDFETGTRAAARGGLTTLIDFAMQDPEHGLVAGIEARMAAANDKVCIDYSLHGGLTKWNQLDKVEVDRTVEMGVPTCKMFMIYEAEGWQSDDAALFEALEYVKDRGARIMVHAESEKVMNLLIARLAAEKEELGAYGHALGRPDYSEWEAIQRAVTWTEVSGSRLYVVHMSTGRGADIVKAAHERGVDVLAETCPQYLLCDDSVFKDRERGHLWATCPQIKKKEDSERLWKGLQDGEVCLVATDTCTFNKEQKAMWQGDFTKIPFGLPGVETLVPSLYTYGVKTGRIDLHRFVEVISTNAAKIMGLFPRKGTIAVGSDADIAIFDPDATKKVDPGELATNCDWNPFEGQELAGFPTWTISRGRVVVDEGQFVGEPGWGRFVKRTPGGGL